MDGGGGDGIGAGGEQGSLGGVEDGEGNLGGLLENEGSTSKKQGSFLPQEPTGKPEPPEKSKEAQRMVWRRMMEESRRRQDEVEMEDKISKESGKKKKKKKLTAVGGEGGKVSDILSFWRRRESTSQTAEQETLVTRKRKIQEPGEHLSCVNRKKLCVDDESEMGKKVKSKVINTNLVSSSRALTRGRDQGGQDTVRDAGLGGGTGAVLSARARMSASHSSMARPDSAADGRENSTGQCTFGKGRK